MLYVTAQKGGCGFSAAHCACGQLCYSETGLTCFHVLMQRVSRGGLLPFIHTNCAEEEVEALGECRAVVLHLNKAIKGQAGHNGSIIFRLQLVLHDSST